MTNRDSYHVRLTAESLVIKNRREVVHTVELDRNWAAEITSMDVPGYLDRLLGMFGFRRDTYWRQGNPGFGLSYSASLVRR